MTSRIDVIASQFNRGLRHAGCSESGILRIAQLIKDKRINAVSFFVTNEGYKVCELIVRIDWNVFQKYDTRDGDVADDIVGLRETGEMIEVETYLDLLLRKKEEKQLRLSYWLSFSDALGIRDPEECYRLKKKLGFEANILGWMNKIGLDEEISILDLPEIKIRIKDIQKLNDQDISVLQKNKALLLRCKRAAEQLICANDEKAGDYVLNCAEYPFEISLTTQGEKKAAHFLDVPTLNDPQYKEIKQDLILSIAIIEEKRLSTPIDDDEFVQENTTSSVEKPREIISNPTRGDMTNQSKTKTSISPNKVPTNRIKRGRGSLVLNLVCAFIILIGLVLRMFGCIDDRFVVLLGLIALISSTDFFLVGVFYDLGWTRYDTIIAIIVFAPSVTQILLGIHIFDERYNLLIEKMHTVFLYMQFSPVLAVSTFRSINFIKNNKKSERRYKILKRWALFMYVLMFLLSVADMIQALKAINS